jgi:hypothetical protein
LSINPQPERLREVNPSVWVVLVATGARSWRVTS